MKEFLQYVEEINNGGYIALKPMIKHAQIIESICKAIGLKDHIEANKLHVTLVYDRREPIIEQYEPLVEQKKATITGCDLYNDALVLTLDSNDLQERFYQLRQLGFKSDYDLYKPHLSLKYGANESDLERVKKYFTWFQLLQTIKLNFEYSEPIKK